MPTQLHLVFFQDGYRRIPGGLYIISTPESKKYLPDRGQEAAWKIGSSWDLGKRINNYLLSFPFDNPGLEIEGVLMMNHANTKSQQAEILEAERWVHKQIHTKYKPAKHYPGLSNGQRLNKDRVEWYRGIPLRVAFNVFEQAQQMFGGTCAFGNENYAHKWRAFAAKKKRKVLRIGTRG